MSIFGSICYNLVEELGLAGVFMKVITEDTINYKAYERIGRLDSKVILRKDLEDLGSSRQVSRALDALVKQGMIAKIGYGIYAKAKKSAITGDLYLPGGFLAIGREALSRLGIKWQMSEAELAYNCGKTRQVPANPPTKLQTRFRRKLSYRGMEMRFE